MDDVMNLTSLSLFYFNRTNMSAEEFLLLYRGPKQLPLYIAIPFTIFNVLIFVTGIVGNISVCVVIIKHSSMHTATNYYLFSLAISDLTLLLFGKLNWNCFWELGGELLNYLRSFGVAFVVKRKK